MTRVTKMNEESVKKHESKLHSVAAWFTSEEMEAIDKAVINNTPHGKPSRARYVRQVLLKSIGMSDGKK